MKTETNPATGLSYYSEAPSDAGDSDLPLVEQARKGDVNAFERLVVKHQKKMLNIAYRMIGEYEEACEAVQDAFLAAYRNLGKFRGDSKFSTWLTTITLNHARNGLKQVRTRRLHMAPSLDEPATTEDGPIKRDLPSNEPSALDQLEIRDVKTKVRQCIEQLEPDFREVIILRDLQDLSYVEMGAVLKARQGTVKSRLFRAREAVKECLKKALGEL